MFTLPLSHQQICLFFYHICIIMRAKESTFSYDHRTDIFHHLLVETEMFTFFVEVSHSSKAS